MFNQNNPNEAINSMYVGDDYIQHNPAVGDGKKHSSSVLKEWSKINLINVFTLSAL